MLHIRLLGNLYVCQDETPLVGLYQPRLQTLFAYLLLHRQTPQLRQQIAFHFWPDSSEKQAHTNLRKLLYQLRNALPEPERFLTQDHLTVQWRPDAPYTLDVAELQELLVRCQQSSDHDSLNRIAQLYQGDLLPGCFDEWILPIRQQLQRQVMQAIEQLIHLAEHQREYQAGIRYAQRLLGIDPLHEGAYRRLMQLHALNGDRTAALHDYHTCATLLQQELGVEPDAETYALYQGILNMDKSGGQPLQLAKARFDTPLVGRTDEWRTLLALWRQSQGGQVHFASIAGEAGIGKSRLAEEMLSWASAQGIRVARTRSYEAEGGLAYAPVTEWLRSPAIKTTLTKLDKVWLSEIARLLPELLSEQTSLTPPAPLSEAWQRQRFFEALARALLIDKSPLLLVIDDLQWCDSETLTWLRFVLRFDQQARLLIIGTWRSEAVAESHPLRTLLRDLGHANQLTSLELAALNTNETAELAQQIATWQIAAPEMQQLYTVTEGHPLFVIETIRNRVESAKWRVESEDSRHSPLSTLHSPLSTLPPKVQNVIQARLAQLSAEARELAGLAATIGRQFSLAVITHASQQPVEMLVGTLDELWQQRIVREVGTGDYDFTHDRIREVAYQSLSSLRRRLLHRRVAEALEAIYANRLDEICGVLAEHYLRDDNQGKAIFYLQRAGERAAAQYVTQTAVEYFTRALGLLPVTNHRARFPLLLARAKIVNHQGKRAEGKRDLEELEQIVRVWDDGTVESARRRAEVALLRADFGRGISAHAMIKAAAQEAAALAERCGDQQMATQAYFMWGYADFWEYDYFNEARRRLEQALALAHATGLHQIEADVLIQLAVYGLYTGALVTEIEDKTQQALALYQQLGNPAGEAGALSILGYIIYTQREGDYERGHRICEQAMQISFDSWDAERLVAGNEGFFCYYQGDYRRAKPLLERQLHISQAAQSWGSEAGAHMELGCLYWAEGDYANAQEQLEASLRLYQENNSRQQYRVKIEGLLALFYLNSGQAERANTHGAAAIMFARQLDDPRIQGDAFTRYARVLVAQDRLAEAADHFHHALRCFRQVEQHNHATMPLAGLTEIALRQGDSLQAMALIEEILAHLQTHQLDRTHEELYVYMTCYRVLKALHEPGAADLLRLAYEQLQVRASSLETESQRALFWSAASHSEVLTEVQNLSAV